MIRALQMRGFGRIDLRLTEEGKLVVVEANPNPEIAQGEDLAEAAAKILGMEWMAELDLGDVPPDYGFADQKDPEKPLGFRLYAVFTSQQVTPYRSILPLSNRAYL